MTDAKATRVALVTGGSSGIGRATAIRLAAQGYTVIVGYNTRREAAEEVVRSLVGGPHVTLRISLEDSAGIAAAAAEVTARFGKLDALVNSGGVTQPVPAGDLDALSDELFDQITTVNLRGPFAVIRAFRTLLEKGGTPAIVNVSSIAARTGVGSNLAYCAAKGGLDTLTVGLAKVLAPKVRVFSVSPAAVDTGFVPGRTQEQLAAVAEGLPLRKVSGPDDVAAAVMVCITTLTSSTGIVLPVDEGRHL